MYVMFFSFIKKKKNVKRQFFFEKRKIIKKSINLSKSLLKAKFR